MTSWLATLLRLFGWRPAPQPPTPAPADTDPAALLVTHNAARAANFLSPLGLDPRLCASAQGHADRMASVGRMAHEGIGDGTFYERILKAGYRPSSAGENIAVGQPTPELVVQAWLSDSAHAANVLGHWTHAGFGFRRGYWCADYASPRNLT